MVSIHFFLSILLILTVELLKTFQVISRKDQERYWYHKDEPYSYVSVDQFSKMFEACVIGKKLGDELSEPYDKSLGHKSALSFSIYSLTKWELLKACVKREYLLMKRNSFIYVFKSTQVSTFPFNILIYINYQCTMSKSLTLLVPIFTACYHCICHYDCFFEDPNES